MVVLVIISLFSTVTVLSMRGLHAREADQEVERLRRVLEIAAETAEVRGMPLSIDFQAQGYRFSALDAGGQWQLLFTPKSLAERPWFDGMSISAMSLNGQTLAPPYRLTFSNEAPEYEILLNTLNGPRKLQGKMSGSVLLIAPNTGEGA